MKRSTLIILALFILMEGWIFGQSVPQTINYQGRLTDNSPQQNPITGSLPMEFAIFSALTGGASLWSETWPSVSINNGIFSVQLGTNTPIPDSLFAGSATRYLEITANSEILTPRQQISSVGYAKQAANGVPSGAVMFFNLPVCPFGWTEYSIAKGRYIVGLPNSGSLNLLTGAPLTNGEDRAVGQHSHGVIDPGHAHSYTSVSSGNVESGFNSSAFRFFASGISTGVSQTGISIANSGTIPGTNAPYIQLLVCVKN